MFPWLCPRFPFLRVLAAGLISGHLGLTQCCSANTAALSQGDTQLSSLACEVPHLPVWTASALPQAPEPKASLCRGWKPWLNPGMKLG